VNRTLELLSSLLAIATAVWLGCASCPLAATPGQSTFTSPEDAADTLARAARSDDVTALRAIFGTMSDKLLFSGDRIADRAQLQRFATAYDEKHALSQDGDGRIVLSVGANDWPLPMPIVRDGTSWRFDTQAGAQEIIDRRVGRNELYTIRVLLAYVDAQKDFFARKASQTGRGYYAERLMSTPGQQDGLYWPTSADEEDSPFGPLVEQAEAEGYPGEVSSGKPIPYQGYYFRVLKAQGPNAPGGAMDYIHSGRMTTGYALLAWPAGYGASGIMTFEVNQDGIVFQRDLGVGTDGMAAKIKQYDPDLNWTQVRVSEQ
jgi:hypothetical protein